MIVWKPVSDLTKEFAFLEWTDDYAKRYLADLGVNVIRLSGPTGLWAEYFDWWVYCFAAAHMGGLRREYWEVRKTTPGGKHRPRGVTVRNRITGIDEVEAAASIIARRALSLQELKLGLPDEYNEAVKRWKSAFLQARDDLRTLGEEAVEQYDLTTALERGLDATKRLAGEEG